MADTIFSKIIKGELEANIIYEDDTCLAFNDINPVAPVHVLIIPKLFIPKLADAEEKHQALLGHMMLKAGHIARQLGIDEAFRLIVNNGTDAGQTIFHLHLHLLAGKTFSWPPT